MPESLLTSSSPLRIEPALWGQWGSACVSDALRALGRAFQSLEGSFPGLTPEHRLAGPAFTVRCYPGATWALEQALELASPGDVLVVDAGGRPDLIVMGALMSQRACSRGLAGAVVDGAVRDVDEIIAIGLPVFARHICPRAGTHAEIGEWQTTICCGRVPVNPGDWVVADRSGVTIVPASMYEETAAEAALIFERELLTAELLRSGESLNAAAVAARHETGH
ncbi:MAG: RraA family protein [Pirellulales bacterium]|nr:RraA family protein [Pirellulales bacterium]